MPEFRCFSSSNAFAETQATPRPIRYSAHRPPELKQAGHARLGFGATARMREAGAHIGNHAPDVVTGKLVLERRHLRVELLTTIRDGPEQVFIDRHRALDHVGE